LNAGHDAAVTVVTILAMAEATQNSVASRRVMNALAPTPLSGLPTLAFALKGVRRAARK
jgi:hypothetical protein